MEIKSYGYGTDIFKKVSVSHWLIPEPLKDPLGAVDHAIKVAEEKLNESGDITNVRTEVRMSLEEYRYMIEEAQKKVVRKPGILRGESLRSGRTPILG